MNRKHAAALLLLLSPLAAQASVHGDVASELDQARQEVRTDMAQARNELEQGNLALGDSLQFGRQDKRGAAKRQALPKGEITPRGDLLVDGKAVAIDDAQRRQLLAYRAQVVDIARTGIDAGERAAMLAIDAVNVSMFRLVVEGMSGSLERKVRAGVKRDLQPMVLDICRRLPRLRDSQQALAANLPAFGPYATLDQEDIAGCERDMLRELAAR